MTVHTSDCAKTKIFGQGSLTGRQNQPTFWVFSHNLTFACVSTYLGHIIFNSFRLHF